MLEQLSSENKPQYQKFCNEFGQALKEGPVEDFENKERVARLLRFASTHIDTPEQTVSLDITYLHKPNQKYVYYVMAASFEAAENRPSLEIFRKNDIEVLLLSGDWIDEWLVAHFTEYQGKQLHSVCEREFSIQKRLSGTETGAEEKTKEAEKFRAETEYFGEVLKRMKDLLKDSVKEVRLGRRSLLYSWYLLDEQDMTAQMEQILKAAGQKFPNISQFRIKPRTSLGATFKIGYAGIRLFGLGAFFARSSYFGRRGSIKRPAGFVQRFNSLLEGE